MGLPDEPRRGHSTQTTFQNLRRICQTCQHVAAPFRYIHSIFDDMYIVDIYIYMDSNLQDRKLRGYFCNKLTPQPPCHMSGKLLGQFLGAKSGRWKKPQRVLQHLATWVFPKIGVPQNGWFILEIPIKMDDLGVPLFSETSKSNCHFLYLTGWKTRWKKCASFSCLTSYL